MVFRGVIPVKQRVHRKRKRPATTTATPPPVLVGVSYFGSGAVLLRFDRAVDASGAQVALIVVSDAGLGQRLRGAGWQQGMAQEVVVMLEAIGPSVGPGVTLSAAAGTNIVAVDGGQPWAGVSNVEIPFP